MPDLRQGRLDEVFAALGAQLASRGARAELVIVGGSALLALGLIDRTTRDVDVVALRSGATLADPRPLPPELAAAAAAVGRDFALPAGWLNPGPASLLDFDLPDGFIQRHAGRRRTILRPRSGRSSSNC